MEHKTVTIKAPADEVARVIKNITTIASDESTGTALMASIGFALILQRPDITQEQLLKAIDEVSSWIVFYLEDMDGIPKEKLN